MSEHEREREAAGQIKVVDRRRFDADGAARQNQHIEDRKKPVVPEAAHKAADKSRQQAQRGGGGQKPTDFLPFVASLATNAMAAMGALPQAQARGMPVDHQMAREYIDIIAMLEERTRGNLSPEEEQAMQRLLAELQRGFVEATRGAAAGGPTPKKH